MTLAPTAPDHCAHHHCEEETLNPVGDGPACCPYGTGAIFRMCSFPTLKRGANDLGAYGAGSLCSSSL
jgi:hypothetical protein